jgi:phage terminase small subunit
VQHVVKTDEVLRDPQHEAFVAEYMKNGGVACKAYAVAYPDAARSPAALRSNSSRLLARADVSARVRALRRVMAEALNAELGELVLQAHEVGTATLHDVMPIETYGCRHCHGVGNAYQWRSPEELCIALDKHLASLATPKPLPRPSAAGGFGYSSRAPVNPECEACRGVGVAVSRIVPTSELSAGARQLVAGVVLRDDGTVERYLLEDRAKYLDQRNKLAGHYVVKTESKSFNVNYNVAAPTTAQPPMSAEDALAKLRAIGVLSPDATPDPTVVSTQP